MISRLHGTLIERDFTEVVVDVNGVGYSVSIPLSTYDKLPPLNAEVTLFTVLAVREDNMQLFGFFTREERTLYSLLVDAVSGIGPKLALSVLSGISIDSFLRAVSDGDVKSLSKINGIGKRTAERIVLELKDKLGSLSALSAGTSGGAATTVHETQAIADAKAALESPGYKRDVAEKAVKELVAKEPNASAEQLIRKALALLNS